MLSKKKVIVSLIINALIFLITVGIFVSYFFEEPNILIRNGFESLRYFTTDSNVLAALISLVIVVCDILILKKKISTLPTAVILLKFVSTVCVMVTFSVTVCYLLPIYGPFVIGKSLFIVHVSTPLMAFFSFLLLENTRRIRIGEMFLPLIPILIYGAVYYYATQILGEANGGWRDFYAFGRSGNFLLMVFIIILCSVAISVLTAVFYNLAVKAAAKKQRSAPESTNTPSES